MIRILTAALGLLIFCVPVVAQDYDPDSLATFSIIARDPATGELGFAVQSKAFAAGNRAVAIKSGIGVIAHQASANPMYGAIGFELLAGSRSRICGACSTCTDPAS